MVDASRAALLDRNVIVVWVVGSKATAELGPALSLSASELRSRYGAVAGVKVVLVGKDGGTK